MAWKQPPFTPTDEQTRIAEAQARRVIVEANAGVGKTTSLCLRVLRLVREGGADPARILMLTFTEPGAEAIRRTLLRLGAPASLCDRLRLGTFDQFCAARLRRMGEAPALELRQPEQLKGAVLAAIEAARAQAHARHGDDFKLHGTGHLIVERLLKDFERLKGALVLQRQGEDFRLTPEAALDTGFDYTTLAIFSAYEADRLGGGPGRDEVRFRAAGDATYDMARALTAEDPAFGYDNHPLRVGALQAVFVDEFHDMNWAMATVLRELLAQYPAVPFTGVGDVDQVIHAESGADSYFLRAGFDIEFGKAERMTLTHAQRFGPGIAEALGAFARKAYPSHPQRAGRLEVLAIDNALELALHIKGVCAERQQRDAKAPLNEVAVLLRHPNAALDLEYRLLNAGVDYETAGFAAYTSRPEVLFVRMLLAAAVGHADAFTARSLEAAKLATWEFIGGALPAPGGADDPDTRAKIVAAPAGAFQQFMLEDLLARTPRPEGAGFVREALAIAASDRVPDVATALKALRMRRLAEHVLVKAEAIRDAADSVLALERIVARENFLSITEMLGAIRAQEDRAQEDWTSKRRIVLSTIEQAKGLEYEHVIIPGLNQGEFDGADEDERHRFYVAVSRAKQVAQLVHDGARPSRFLQPG
ncbi:ATP-dependent helicase [Mitsuaria sp. GD03876]|uniref:ATP-dependent helicase n=1 Tax=Mitsuaria sp. GD03876 TaxID=2975399 RepID=UPI00244BBF85|nr:ATP-dependent helicase [Mitsuaria sp. GD03876]MDH0865044.1 ATP-dependent helicase [Mitsuaria sp. GD03876]